MLAGSKEMTMQYNACSILCHIVADGEHRWTVDNLNKRAVEMCIKQTVDHWKMGTQMNIVYR